jgi:hypothetical protein
MLGIQGKPPSPDGKTITPPVNHGLQMMSMGLLVENQAATIWRGPMASQAFDQLLRLTNWGQTAEEGGQPLDYLVVDMPPGTGDIHLSISQRAPLTAAVIVTTPQDIALLDARKGLQMFEKVSVPVLGVVENMAVFCCPNCGHEEHIFGQDGGKKNGTRPPDGLPRCLAARYSHPHAGRWRKTDSRSRPGWPDRGNLPGHRPQNGGYRGRKGQRLFCKVPDHHDLQKYVSAEAPPVGTRALHVGQLRAGRLVEARDSVAEELAVALEYNGVSHAVMLATPADLEDFARGFSLTEGVVDDASQIRDIGTSRSAQASRSISVLRRPRSSG